MLEQHCIDGFLKVSLTDNSVNAPAEVASALYALIHGFRGIGKTDNKITWKLINLIKEHKETLNAKFDLTDSIK
jgi:hypothetical protein